MKELRKIKLWEHMQREARDANLELYAYIVEDTDDTTAISITVTDLSLPKNMNSFGSHFHADKFDENTQNWIASIMIQLITEAIINTKKGIGANINMSISQLKKDLFIK